ncbi:MAG TPA: GNAT family N-acetyltransferase [Verrucomicrobiae bacterium]|nr:GNAT family N-acetyltransferase [Verrucomicrobiae bacterium]
MSFIETPRLLIRAWMLPGDAADALEIFGDPQAMRFLSMGAVDAQGSVRMVERMIEQNEQDGFAVWPVVSKETSHVIGESGITYIPGSKDVQIAWLYKPAAWGCGYATEAARAVLHYAFEAVGLERIYALIDRENAASIAVANRLGMSFDRIVRAYKRDLMRYVITPTPASG